MKYLYVLDYTKISIYEIKLDEHEDKNDNDLLKQYSLDTGSCVYMYSETKLNIETINKIKDE